MAWAEGDSYERLMSVLTYAAWKEFDRPATFDGFGAVIDPGFFTVVLGTFPDAIVFEDVGAEKLYESSYVLSGDAVVFGKPQEVQEMYAEKRMAEIGLPLKRVDKQEMTELSLSGPIVMKSEDEKRIAYAAVLVPGEPDSDDEVLTAGKIEEAAHGWMESYRNVDLMHTLNNTGVPVESYILPEAMKVEAYGEPIELPAGTWILASKLSEEAWRGVKDGTLTGYSVMGIKKVNLEAVVKSSDGVLDDAAFKRTLLADLGPDWVAAFVSVVDHPAVPKAKFFALKSQELRTLEAAEEASPDGPRFFAKVGKALGLTKTPEDTVIDVDDTSSASAGKSEVDAVVDSAEKAGRRYSDKTYNSLKTACEALVALIAEAESERAVSEKHDGNEDAAKSDGTSEGPVTDMDEAQLQVIIAEAVTSAVEPIVARLEALEAEEPVADETDAADASVEEPAEPKKAEDEEPEDEEDEEPKKAEDEEPEDEEDEEPKKAEDAPAEEDEDEEDEEPKAKAEDEEDEEDEESSEPKAKAEDEDEEDEEDEESSKPKKKSADEAVVETAEKAEEIASLKAAVAAAEAQAAENAAFKAEMAEKVGQLEKRLSRVSAASKALPVDGSGSSEESVEDTSGRDAFGRRIR